MEVPAVVSAVLGLLWQMGIPMDIETLKVLAGWTAPVIAAVLTYLVAIRKTKNDAKSTDMANLISRMDKMQTRLDEVERELREEREKNAVERAERRSERDEDRAVIRGLQEDIRDRDELILDMADHMVLTDEWLTTGAEPPNPAKSWRVRQYLRSHKVNRPTTDENETLKGE